jgi:SpoVK/Ycf46/Vps4 family AAA+-type ATPase
MAAAELESLAAKYATEAIKLDQQGSRGMALAKYQRTVEILLKLCALYPNHPLRSVYVQHVVAYSNRIKALQGQIVNEEPVEKGEAKFDELVVREKPDVKWEDIAGLENAKRAVEESITYPVKRPDLFPLGWPRGILLFGPPGCGKTLMAAAIATEVNAAFYCVDAASIMSKWLGESEKNVAQLFANARQIADSQPAILFIDEIDSLVGIRREEVGGEVRVRNQFLKEMDGIVDKSKKLHVYVIGATNKPWALDEPFIRRFQRRILVPIPSLESRVQLFEIYTKGLRLGPDVDLTELAKMTEGYTGSDIHDVCQTAQIKVVRELFESAQAEDKQAQPRMLAMQDFQEVLKGRSPSVAPEMIKNYDLWYERFKAI